MCEAVEFALEKFGVVASLLLTDGADEPKDTDDAVRLALPGVLLPSLTLEPDPHKSSTLVSSEFLGVLSPEEPEIGAFLGVLPPGFLGVLSPEVPEVGALLGVLRGVLPPGGEAHGVRCPEEVAFCALREADAGDAACDAAGPPRGVLPPVGEAHGVLREEDDFCVTWLGTHRNLAKVTYG